MFVWVESDHGISRDNHFRIILLVHNFVLIEKCPHPPAFVVLFFFFKRISGSMPNAKKDQILVCAAEAPGKEALWGLQEHLLP